jgi:hypothetical protein
MNKIDQFVSDVSGLSFRNAFNPYRDRCEIYDVPDSPDVRRDFLKSTLNAAYGTWVDYLWVGRDLGYRGGRRTGLALTDDAHVTAHLQRWNILKDAQYIVGPLQAERTASIIWRMLDQIPERVFLWNVFPLHPHEPEKPLSNRAHTAVERNAGEELLDSLVRLLRPRAVIAIGQDASRSASRCCDVEVLQVRHPSYGGIRDFDQSMSRIFRL